jgi:hypothetical protein
LISVIFMEAASRRYRAMVSRPALSSTGRRLAAGETQRHRHQQHGRRTDPHRREENRRIVRHIPGEAADRRRRCRPPSVPEVMVPDVVTMMSALAAPEETPTIELAVSGSTHAGPTPVGGPAA